MNRTTLASIALTAVAFTLASCTDGTNQSNTAKQTSEPSPLYEGPLAVEESATVMATARVDAIDQASRMITLEDSSGRKSTYLVGSRVQRLNEVKVGDTVTTEYSVSLQAERRQPTADEAAHPITVISTTGRAPQDASPAGGDRLRVRVVTTVAALDPGNMLVTLKGPMDDTTTVRARKQENFQRLRVGDTIIINYVETAVLSLTKR